MSETKGQECHQAYIEKLEGNENLRDSGNDGFIEGNTFTNLNSKEGDSVGEDNDRKGAIIIDSDGGCYYQSSEEIVEVQPLTKVSEVAEKSVAAVPKTNKRKNYAEKSFVSSKKPKLRVEQTTETKCEETDEKNANATIELEIDDQEKVYEFDENEQDPDDPQDVVNPDCESKLVIKNVKKFAENEPGSFSCMVCAYQTNKKFLLSRHLKIHCDERPFKCAVCERGFKTKCSLKNHRNIHLGHKPHACTSCDMAFTTSGELVRHVRYRHTHIKPHKCTECDYSSVEMSKLRRHMRCHTGERPYQCPQCTYASADSFKLKRHMRIHTGEKPYECDICHARFTQGNSLKHHRFIHLINEKPVFQCHLCPTTCGRKTDLRLHMKNLHSSDNPIPCKRCGKELPDRYSYKMHIKTHEGEKCYRCEYCPYASISQRHLEAHILIHLDVKPFTCEFCQISFRQKQLLTRHVKIYHSDNYVPPQPRKKDHKCPHCNKMFAFNGNLIRHMEIHDETSRRFEEKLKLRIGRMKRIKPDGTVVTEMPSNSSSKLLDDSEELLYEEQQPVENEELEEEYEEAEEYNEDNIQYVYDEYEDDENEEQFEEEQYEQQQDETNKETLLIEVKPEKIQDMSTPQTSLALKLEDKIDSDIMVLEEGDDQGFMVIEVLPADECDEEQEQEKVLQVQQKETKPTIINKNAKESTVKKWHKNSQSLISDYFGFEINSEEEEGEETKGVIEILEIIEQE